MLRASSLAFFICLSGCAGDHASPPAGSSHSGAPDGSVGWGNGGDAGAGAYATVQDAVNAAVARGGTNRVYILVSPGTYREVVCVPSGAPPITLYGAVADPARTVIAYNHYSGETKTAGMAANPCTPSASAITYGTAGSATFSAFANGFQAKNITFSNDVTIATLSTTAAAQAVALMTEADQVILDNVQVLGHQDTLYAETPNADTVVRAYVKNSYVSGDVDFIFGGATLVLDTCQIHFVSDRKSSGQALAPDTDSRNPYGMLIINSNFSADANTAAGAVGLGRSWDRSCVDVPTYLSTCMASGHFPNGQAVVRNSTLGVHIATAPWLPAATTKRAFCSTPWACLADAGVTCPANRFYEYANSGSGSAVAADSGDAASPVCAIKRPQWTDAQAAGGTVLNYLELAGSLSNGLATDNWDPTGGVGDVSSFRPTYTVTAR